MLICDSGPILAALSRRDVRHGACAELLRRFGDELALPAPVVTETALFLARSYGTEPHLRFLESVASAELEVLDLEVVDHRRVAELCRDYVDLPLDQVDASVIALAEHYGEQQVASLDHRHLAVVRLADGGYLELLPSAD